MKIRTALLLAILALALTACRALQPSEARASTSLVGFLYPTGDLPPRDNSMPQLRLPVRVGLAFLPSRAGMEPVGLEAARRDELLRRIRERFADRKFVSEIVIVPDYYLKGGGGFESLQGVQRLYDVDVMALVSYDQVTYRDDNKWSLGYLTIVGAYVVKGTRHDVTTLMDLAVVDPASRSILLRAGGTDDRHGTTTLIDANRESRRSRGDSFDRATDELIEHFDTALTTFETDVRKGKTSVQVVQRAGRGGAGALDAGWLVLLAIVLWGHWLARRREPTHPRSISRSSSRRWGPVPKAGALRSQCRTRPTPRRGPHCWYAGSLRGKWRESEPYGDGNEPLSTFDARCSAGPCVGHGCHGAESAGAEHNSAELE